MVGTGRFELPTSRLSVVRSNQLSYAPVVASHYGTQPIWHRPSGIELSGRDSLGGGGRGVHPLFFLRKEVIQPQVPLRLPCYDFTPVADLTVADCLLAVSASSLGKTNFHGVTGGVYKARERIHRSMLIYDY